MRKIISIILCVMMLLSLLPASAEEMMELSVNTDHLQVVKSLGILDGFSNYDSDASSITRGEFAKVITGMINMDDLSVLEAPRFSDVTEGHAYYNQIAVANMLGIMVGDENGNFMPDKPITYAQAVKCILYVLGYAAHAEKSGGYPIGYAVEAQRMDILDRVSYQTDKLISRASLAQMIYNCLDVPLMDIDLVSKDIQYSILQSETILSRYLEVRKFEAILNSVDGRSILSRAEDTDKGCAKFGSTVLSYTDASVAGFLGYRMEVYATDKGNGIEELIYAFPTDDNQELMIKASDLLSGNANFSLTDFYYNSPDGKTTVAKLTASHRFVYNGAYDLDFDTDDLEFETGYVKLIDHDNDDIYDVCLVWSYENYVMESAAAEVINCHYNKTLRKGNEDEVTYRVLSGDGEWGDWDQLMLLSNWDVLSVATSKDGSLVTIYSTRSGVGGTVEAIVTDGTTRAQINGYEYIISEQYLNMPANSGYTPIKAGLRSEFYFDVVGEIAAVYTVGSADNVYGYLMNAGKLTGMSQKYQVKIFSEDGKVNVYDTEDKIKFSSSAYEEKKYKTDEVMELFKDDVGNVIPQMVCYSADEAGVLTEIHQASDATALGYNLDKFSIDFDSITVAENYNYQNSTDSFISNSSYDKLFHIGGMTKVFYVPRENGEFVEDSLYIIDHTTIFDNNDDYGDIQVFDCDDTYTASVVLYSPNTDSTGTEEQEPNLGSRYFLVINDVYVGKDTDGEMKPMVKGFLQGMEGQFTYETADGFIPEEGSIVQYRTNLQGTLILDEDYVLYSPRAGATLTERNNIKGSGQLPLIWSQIGRLWRKNSSAISVYVGAERPWAAYLNKPVVYKYSEDTGKFQIADESVLIPSTGNPHSTPDGSLMLLNYCYHYVRELFVIED